MIKNRTRNGRGNLIRQSEMDLENLKNNAINVEVADLAISFHGILSTISSKYSEDAVAELIPDITAALSRLDAALKVNEDLKQVLTEVSQENNLLLKSLENEKNKRKQDFEDSLVGEEKADEQIRLLKSEIECLEKNKKILKEEIEAKNLIINLITTDYEDLSRKINQNPLQEQCLENNDFHTPKMSIRSRVVTKPTPAVDTNNRFSALSVVESSPSCSNKIQVEAQVHEQPTAVKSVLNHSTPLLNKPVACLQDKSRVVVLADSQGKGLYKHLEKLGGEHEVFISSAPGAKLKHVVKNGLPVDSDFKEQDFIFLLAGSNDVDHLEPYQLTVTEGLDSLFALPMSTNIVVCSIPYRYDDVSLNNRVFFANQLIFKAVNRYNGDLKITYFDVNEVLSRKHFSKHGLHYSRSGKAVLGRCFRDLICRQKCFLRTVMTPPTPTSRDGPVQNMEDNTSGNTCTKAALVESSFRLDAIAPFPDTSSDVHEVGMVRPEECPPTNGALFLGSSTYNEDFPPLPPPLRSLPNSPFLGRPLDLILDRTV